MREGDWSSGEKGREKKGICSGVIERESQRKCEVEYAQRKTLGYVVKARGGLVR